MLSDKQLEAINLLLEGKPKTQIAKDLNIQRSTLYNWLNNEEFIATMDKRRDEFLKDTMNAMKSDVNVLLDQIKKIALTSENESMRLQACQALLDRIIGKPSTKSEISIENNNKLDDIELDDIDTLLEEDNVINLEDKKAK